MAEIKGKALLGLLEFVKRLDGEEETQLWDETLKSLPDSEKTFSRKINPFLNYPFSDLIEPLKRLDQRMNEAGQPDLIHQFGRWAAKHDYAKSYRTIFNPSYTIDPSDIVKCADFLWTDNFKGMGELEVESLATGEATLRWEGSRFADEPFCQLISGWMAQTLRMIAGRGSRTNIEIQSMGGGSVRFALAWELPQAEQSDGEKIAL